MNYAVTCPHGGERVVTLGGIGDLEAALILERRADAHGGPWGPRSPRSPFSPLSPYEPGGPCAPAGPVGPAGPCGPGVCKPSATGSTGVSFGVHPTRISSPYLSASGKGRRPQRCRREDDAEGEHHGRGSAHGASFAGADQRAPATSAVKAGDGENDWKLRRGRRIVDRNRRRKRGPAEKKPQGPGEPPPATPPIESPPPAEPPSGQLRGGTRSSEGRSIPLPRPQPRRPVRQRRRPKRPSGRR